MRGEKTASLPPNQMWGVTYGEYEMKQAIPNLQVIEEQVRVRKVEDHLFHHQADAHGRRGVLPGGGGRVTCE